MAQASFLPSSIAVLVVLIIVSPLPLPFLNICAKFVFRSSLIYLCAQCRAQAAAATTKEIKLLTHSDRCMVFACTRLLVQTVVSSLSSPPPHPPHPPRLLNVLNCSLMKMVGIRVYSSLLCRCRLPTVQPWSDIGETGNLI